MPYFGAPAASSASSVIALPGSPNGIWTDIPDAKFVHYNGKVYLGWVDSVSGDILIASYTVATDTLSTPFVLHAALAGLPSAPGNPSTPDLHNSPSILVRDSDQKIVVAYCAHQGAALYVRISTNAEDVTAFEAEVDIDSQVTGTAYTYVSLIELTGEGAIYLWFRDKIPTTNLIRQAYTKSTDDAATWGTEVKVWVGDNTTTLNYRRIATNGVDRMDLFVTDTDRSLATPSSLYHLYYVGGVWHTSDGVSTGLAAGHFPVNATLVKGTTDGPVIPGPASYDGSDNPVANFATYTAADDVTIWQARWDGSAWNVVEIASTNGKLGGNPFLLSSAIDHANVSTVWLPRKVGSHFEMFRYTSADDGATWSGLAITSGSSEDHMLPDIVWNHDADVKVIWGYGTHTDSNTFDTALMAGY